MVWFTYLKIQELRELGGIIKHQVRTNKIVPFMQILKLWIMLWGEVYYLTHFLEIELEKKHHANDIIQIQPSTFPLQRSPSITVDRWRHYKVENHHSLPSSSFRLPLAPTVGHCKRLDTWPGTLLMGTNAVLLMVLWFSSIFPSKELQ